MGCLLRVIIIAAVLAPWSRGADAAPYDTARSLLSDCAAPDWEPGRRQHCGEYLDQNANIWTMNQPDPYTCLRPFKSEIREAYVQYWAARSERLSSGEVLSAEASVMEFLNSQTQPCPQPPPHAAKD
jgi:hypothetical protein